MEAPVPTESAKQALAILRQGSQTFQRYVIPLMAFVFYVYTVEAEKRNGTIWTIAVLSLIVFIPVLHWI
jgi:hypothetical protein